MFRLCLALSTFLTSLPCGARAAVRESRTRVQGTTGHRLSLPASYSTMLAGDRVADGVILLWSLALHHRGACVFVSTDSKSRTWISKHSPALERLLVISWSLELNNYDTSLKRTEMETRGIWPKFQMEKAKIIDFALRQSPNTIFLDADTIVTGPILVPHGGKAVLGVSPHFATSMITQKYGFYNGGFLWAADPAICAAWINATQTSRFYDQAALEDLTHIFPTYVFPESVNVGWWRMQHGPDGPDVFKAHVRTEGEAGLTYKGHRISSMHGHFVTDDCCSKDFATFMLSRLKAAKDQHSKKLLAIIEWVNATFSTPEPLLNEPQIDDLTVPL